MTDVYSWQRVAACAHRLSWLKVGVMARKRRGLSVDEIKAIRVRVYLPAAIAGLTRRLWARGHDIAGVPHGAREAADDLIAKIVTTEQLLLTMGATRLEWREGGKGRLA